MPDIAHGINMEDMCQEIYDLFPIMDDTWANYGYTTPTITSGRREPEPEDIEKENPSFHFFGQAIDIWTDSMPDDAQDELVHDLQVRLGPFYQVVSEHFIRRTRNHIHIEMDSCANYPYASSSNETRKEEEQK